jgi:hypothetical protein
MTGDAQTTHEYLIPIARFFAVVRSGWLGILEEGSLTGELLYACRPLQTRSDAQGSRWMGEHRSDCRDSPL